MKNLWLRVITPFVLFVVAGTVGLLFLLNATYQHRSRNQFVALANANAEFIRASRIPTTDRFAGYLSQVLGVEVAFQRLPAPDDQHEAVTVPIMAGTDLTLIRETPKLLLRPATLVALAAFWALSLALAWAVVVPYLRAQRLALLGQMATSLAHEIQNPVAAIRLHAQLAGHQTILGEAATIESLVNQWMFLARPESPQKSPVALDALLADAVHALTPLADHARVRVEVVCGSGHPAATVDADARRLGQVFRNLIVNAIQALPGGGTLTITVTGRTITFADTGKGFSATALARCPELFYSEKEGGMGIGLAVVREIVHAHGGRLVLANRPTGGAEVRIEL
jgi:signal transduction histidine kinase